MIHDLEVVYMNVLRMISDTSRRDQWEDQKDDTKGMLKVESVEEAAGKSRLRWCGH